MNFKTTLILLVLLLSIGLVVLFTRDKTKTDEKPAVHTLVDVKPGEVTAITVTDADGKTWGATKTLKADGTPRWNFTQPKAVIADANDIDSLLSDITGLKSTAQSTASAAATGTDHPLYTVSLTANGKVYSLAVGQPVSDGVYVRLDNGDKADVVSGSFLSTLDRPSSDKPRSHLFDIPAADVSQVTVTKPAQPPLTVAKNGTAWQVGTGPTTMPADSGDATSLVSALVDMQPTAVVESTDLANYGLDDPVATIDFKPDTAGAKPTELKVGRFEDAQKKNLFVGLPGNLVATVPASLMTYVDKKPVEYHDRSVLTFDSATVKKIRIATGQLAYAVPTTKPAAVPAPTTKPAAAKAVAAKAAALVKPPTNLPTTLPATTQAATTQAATTQAATTQAATTEPTTQPATTQPLEATVTQTIVLTPRIPWSTILDKKLGPPAPETRPTTGPTTTSTTAPTTLPTTRAVEPDSKWVLSSDHDAPADDNKVTTLLGELSNLKAEKFLDPVPPEKPGKTYEVEIVTGKPERFVLHVFDPGDGSPLIGSMNGLTFELSSTLAGELSGDFKPGSAPVSPPPSMGGMGGGLPPGFDPRMLRGGGR